MLKLTNVKSLILRVLLTGFQALVSCCYPLNYCINKQTKKRKLCQRIDPLSPDGNF